MSDSTNRLLDRFTQLVKLRDNRPAALNEYSSFQMVISIAQMREVLKLRGTQVHCDMCSYLGDPDTDGNCPKCGESEVWRK